MMVIHQIKMNQLINSTMIYQNNEVNDGPAFINNYTFFSLYLLLNTMSYIFIYMHMGKFVQNVSITVGIYLILIGPGEKTLFIFCTAFEFITILSTLVAPKNDSQIPLTNDQIQSCTISQIQLQDHHPPSQSKPQKYIQKYNLISVRGLSNLGNTCYMNAAIQCLHKTVQLTSSLKINKLQTKDFVQAYLNLMNQLSQENHKPCNPKQLKMLIERYNNQFFGNHQQDSSQLLMAVLNYISEQTQEIDKPIFKEPNMSVKDDQRLCKAFKERDHLRSKSVLDKIFVGRFLTVYECQECGNQEKIFEKFQLIHLPIPRRRGASLQDCMKQFCKRDQLAGENAWYCDRCGKDTRTHKFMSVYEANQILMICLKRFNFRGDKIREFINFDEEITLKDISSNPKIQGNKYQLYGVINHSGYSLNYGHYYSYCHDGTTWKEYNDSLVREAPNIVSENAFVLFYRKKQP